LKIPVVDEILKYSRLALDLRWFLRGNITLEESKQVIINRLRERNQNFLDLVKKGIYENPRSPYLKLLKVADCEFGDIEALVRQEGIEVTLNKLLAAGVYVGWEEFKGKREVVRGSQHCLFHETDFDNPYLAGYFHVRSNGSRSAGTRTVFDLRHQLAKNYYNAPMLAANNALNASLGLWQSSLPSSAGIGPLLHYWKIGNPIARWFSPVTEREVQANFRDKLAARYIIYGSRILGVKLVRPEYVGLQDAVKIARWMAETKQQFGDCLLLCFVSPAVMVCQAAMENSLDIRGTHFFVGGEPLTEAKRQQIEATGALVTPRYYITETGIVGCGCAIGGVTDDVHLLNDSVAIIQRQRKVDNADIDVNAFLITGLLATSPKILLNVETDDYGVLETRQCGCLWDQLGLNQHLHSIRSYSKLTGSGMTIMGSDLVRILEEVLPGKYGGTATDYQLLEEEDAQSQTHLSLVISPTVGEIGNDDVIRTVLDELRQSIHGGRLAAGFWSQVNTLQIKRMYPLSSSGKIMTLHLMKKDSQLVG
jgi:hypothetical protein